MAEEDGRLVIIEVDDDYVYYGGDTAELARVDKDGSNKLIIREGSYSSCGTSAGECAYFSTIGGGRLYWSNDWTGAALRWCATPECASLDTIDPTAAPDPTNFIALTYEGNAVYYGNTAGEIYRTSSLSTGADSWVTGENKISGLVSNGGVVYWGTVNDANSAIRKKSTVGGAVSDVVTDIDPPGAMAVSKDRVYWAVGGGSIFSAALPEGGPELTAEPTYPPRDMVVSNGYLYWTANTFDVGLIERCPLADCLGNEETMADMQDRPWGITADANRVWWVTASGTVNYVAQ